MPHNYSPPAKPEAGGGTPIPPIRRLKPTLIDSISKSKAHLAYCTLPIAYFFSHFGTIFAIIIFKSINYT